MDDNRDDRIESKLDKVGEDIGEIKITLAEQHMSLKEHIRRTENLEEAVVPLQKQHTIIAFCMKVLATLIMSGVLIVLLEKIIK